MYEILVTSIYNVKSFQIKLPKKNTKIVL